MKVLGIIPARGGSKGIPQKNSKLLSGKPLIGYTIEAAIQSKYLDTVLLSSDDSKLIEIAKSYGLDVPFVRPAHLATDTSPTLDTVLHALNYLQLQGEYYDAVCLLQPTNPLRTSAFIDQAIETFTSSGADALISVLEVPHEYNPHWTFTENEKGLLRISTGDTSVISRRQDLPKAYYRDGSIYITKTSVLLEQKSLYGKSVSYLKADPERHVNIDTLDDWERAEQLLAKINL